MEIKYTVSKVTKEISKNKTKTLSSHRTYPLLPQAKEIFLKEKAEEESNERFFGKGYDKNDYVFKNTLGKPNTILVEKYFPKTVEYHHYSFSYLVDVVLKIVLLYYQAFQYHQKSY